MSDLKLTARLAQEIVDAQWMGPGGGEWGDGLPTCPWCYEEKDDGHNKADCIVLTAKKYLKTLKEEGCWRVALCAWLAVAQDMVEAYDLSLDLRNPMKRILEVDPEGKKLVRIVVKHVRSNGRSVFCFIERETGDVLFAKTWAHPSDKKARGNIYDPERPGVDHSGALPVIQV